MSVDLVRVEDDEVEKVRKEIQPVLDRAKSITVADQESYNEALQLASACKTRITMVEDVWKASREAAYKAWKTITETIASFTKPLEEAAKICSRKAYDWKSEEEKRRQIEADRVRKENQKKLEDERLRQAEAVAAQGKPELADAILSEDTTVAPVEPEKLEKPAGVTMRENWQFEIVDEKLLPREFLTPDTKKIGQVVKAMKAATAIPGVKVYDVGSVAVARK